MGVLDIGSNTGHLLVVDAFRGGPPVPAHSYKEPLRLTDHLDSSGAIDEDGVARLGKYMIEAKAEAEDKGCTQIRAFATSAVRDAINADDVIKQVNTASGLELEVLAGEDEARLTFLLPAAGSAGRPADSGCSTSAAAPLSWRSALMSLPTSRHRCRWVLGD